MISTCMPCSHFGSYALCIFLCYLSHLSMLFLPAPRMYSILYLSSDTALGFELFECYSPSLVNSESS